MPRQNLFLNGSKLLLKGNKPLKLILLRRIVRFYRRKFRKINLTTFSDKLLNKNLKYKFKLIKARKRNFQFLLPTLADSKFCEYLLHMNRIIRRGNSRLKLRRTKKYYLQYLQLLKYSLPKSINFSLVKYFRLSRVRYLNRFFRQSIRRYKMHHFINTFSNTLISKQIASTLNATESFISCSSSTDYYSNPFLNSTPSNVILYKDKVANLVKNFQTTFIQGLGKLFNKTHRTSPLYITHKPISILSKYKTPFIFSTIGFIFIQNLHNQPSSYIKSRFNRFRYSFFFKKDLKRYLLKKPGKLKLISSGTLFTNYKTKYNRFGKPFIASYFSHHMNQLCDITEPLLINNLLTSQNPFFSYKTTRKYTNYLGSFFKKEVRIKRIKFKPGYSRI